MNDLNFGLAFIKLSKLLQFGSSLSKVGILSNYAVLKILRELKRVSKKANLIKVWLSDVMFCFSRTHSEWSTLKPQSCAIL